MEPEWPFEVELARLTEVWARLLEVHVAGGDGRCRACTSQVRPADRWPCTLYRAAARARRIAAARSDDLTANGCAAQPAGGL